MPGPTTESLATDFRDSSRDFVQFREDFAGFKGRIETQLSLVRWVGTFIAAMLFSLVGSGVWLTWHASALNQRVEGLERTTLKVVDRQDKLEQATHRVVDRQDKLEQAMIMVVDRLEQLERTTTRIADRLDQTLGPVKPKPTNP